jgi:hypothetical protein
VADPCLQKRARGAEPSKAKATTMLLPLRDIRAGRMGRKNGTTGGPNCVSCMPPIGTRSLQLRQPALRNLHLAVHGTYGPKTGLAQ